MPEPTWVSPATPSEAVSSLALAILMALPPCGLSVADMEAGLRAAIRCADEPTWRSIWREASETI